MKYITNVFAQKWDDTLANVAGYNARSCIIHVDKCRNTHVHPQSGQNVGYQFELNDYYPDSTAIQRTVSNWFEENVDCKMDTLASFTEQKKGQPSIGNFTQMVQEKSGHVGCALVRFFDSERFTSYLVCNYGYMNTENKQVYTVGEQCSECPSGMACSTTFPGLCV